MSTVKECYSVTLHPGKNIEQTAGRLALMIIDRWMPNHAGGAPLLLGAGLQRQLIPMYERINRVNKPMMIEVSTMRPQIEIREAEVHWGDASNAKEVEVVKSDET